MLNREIVLQELKKYLNGLTLAELRTLVIPQIDPRNNIDTVLNTALVTLRNNHLVTRIQEEVRGRDKKVYRYFAVMTSMEKLEAISYLVPCDKAQALLGLGGEVGEVLEEVQFDFITMFPREAELEIKSFVRLANDLDRRKKHIVQGKASASIQIRSHKQYEENLADVLYYFMFLTREKGLNHYAQLAFDKVIAKNPDIKI